MYQVRKMDSEQFAYEGAMGESIDTCVRTGESRDDGWNATGMSRRGICGVAQVTGLIDKLILCTDDHMDSEHCAPSRQPE